MDIELKVKALRLLEHKGILTSDEVLGCINVVKGIKEEVNIPVKSGNVIDYSNNSVDNLFEDGSVIRFSGKGQKIFPNVSLRGGTYIVKASTDVTMTYYDCNNNKSHILIGDKQKMWQPYSSIRFGTPGIIEVTNTNSKWEIEMVRV